MAYKTGVAEDYLDMMAQVKRFACGYPLPGTPSFSGSGSGKLSRVDSFSNSVAETWTITCTAASAAKTATTLSLTNGDAESGDMTGWDQYDERPSWTVTDAGNAHTGDFYFTGGMPVGFDEVASVQRLDLVSDGLVTADIDAQACVFQLDWWEQGATSDQSQFLLRFLDSGGNLISEQNTEAVALPDNWSSRRFRWTLPVGCRYVDVVMIGYMDTPPFLDTYLDDITAKVDTYPARFSLSGSATGSLGSCSAHDGYQKFSHLSFFLTDPSVNFQTGDQFTVVFSSNELNGDPAAWTELDFEWRVLGREPRAELYLQGPGWSGNDEIFIGFREWRDSSKQAFSWRLNGYTAYVGGTAFHDRPGAISDKEPLFTSWDQATAYWLFVSGGRIMLVNKMGTVYSHLYMGFVKTYYTPSQYPYPLAIGGSSFAGSGAESYTSVDPDHNAYWSAHTPHDGSASSFRLRSLEGAWKTGRTITDASIYGERFLSSNAEVGIFPWYVGNLAGLAANLDGSYPVFPSAVHYDDGGSGLGSTSFHGELEGLYGVPGRANASENTVTIGADTYAVFQTTYDVGTNQFCALKLE